MTELTVERYRMWYASLPGLPAVACALITDRARRVLLVKPTYEPRWLLPGGIVEAGEPPNLSCEREVKEELGVALRADRLLVVDWCLVHDQADMPLLCFIFDCDTVDDGQPIRLPAAELAAYEFVEPDAAATRLAPYDQHRLGPALAARASGGNRIPAVYFSGLTGAHPPTVIRSAATC